MSYDIYIGHDDCGEVRHMERPDAPCFPGDTMTASGNSRHPGYSQWALFCERVGLYSLWLGVDGLLREHPGCAELTWEHLAGVRAALARHVTEYGAIKPGWCPHCERQGGDHDDALVQPQSGDRARLLWMEWWMDYALKEYSDPAVANH